MSTTGFTLICPTCFGAGEIRYQDERYGHGFGVFVESIPCWCQPIEVPTAEEDEPTPITESAATTLAMMLRQS